ncbi:MAG: pitrilysin family protein [Bacteroidota bacterium]|nr:insulinase family protein [Candidatus Kapabacteria bacterium]MDW8221015.1 pitrilysin family protein [Bacteroidota bacterium]
MTHSIPPRISELPSFSLPSYCTIELTHRIPLITVEHHEQQLATVSVVSHYGAAYDTVWGETNCMVHLLNKGTRHNGITYNAQDIAERIDSTGGSISLSCSFDSISIQLSILPEFLSTGLDVLCEILQYPSFPADELERLRQQMLVEIEQANNDPAYLASIAFTQGIFHNEPYGHPVIGTLTTLQLLNQDTCTTAYQRSIHPSCMFAVAAGNVCTERLKDELNARLCFADAPIASPILPQTQQSAKPSPTVVLIEKAHAVQTALRIGFRTIHRSHPDYIALKFLNTILGGSFISRLNYKLREEKGYTYGVHSIIDARKYASVLTIQTHVSNDVVDCAVHDILSEIERLRVEPVTDEELETTRHYMIGTFLLRTETPSQVASLLSTLHLYGLSDTYYTEYIDELASITKERLFEVQQRHLLTDTIVIAASGNIELLESKLRNFGTIRIVDTHGTLLPS